MKILNLFSGIGGNRTLWGNKHDITAIEFNDEIAKVYKLRFPHDCVIITDALSYLEKFMDLYDFIWVSPVCKTHSRLNTTCQNMRIPDLTSLYGTIIFLSRFCKKYYCVENVVPYYEPIIKPSVKIGRHLFWSNFEIPEVKFDVPKGTIKDMNLQFLKEYNLINESIKVNREMLRNCVDYRIGKYILDIVEKLPKK